MYLFPLAHSGPQSTAGLRGIDPRDLSEGQGPGPQQGRTDGIWGDEAAMEKWGKGKVPGSWQRQGAQKAVEIKPRLQISSGISPARTASGCSLSPGGQALSLTALRPGPANCLLTPWAP